MGRVGHGMAQSPLDAQITAQMAAQHLSGLAAVLVKGDSIVWRGNYGLANRQAGTPVTDSTIFMLASVSKTVTATALMQLVEQGLLGLDDPVNAHLPFTVENPAYPDPVITVRQLVTHTASIRDNWNLMPYHNGDSPIPLGDYLFDYLDPAGDDYDPDDNYGTAAPGTAYAYSNIGIALCGHLVETVTGIPFNTYCHDSIFAPLCMDRTGWFLAEVDAASVAHPYAWDAGTYVDEGLYGYSDYPAGQLRTTALALARFMAMHMDHGRFDGLQVLDTATVALMQSPVVPAVDPTQGIVLYSFTDVYGTWWGHGGGDLGVTTAMYFDPVADIGLVILTNGDGDLDPVRAAILNALGSLQSAPLAAIACHIALPTATEEVPIPRALLLHPNPATDRIGLTGCDPNDELRICDMTGRPVLMQPCTGMVDVRGLAPGTYLVQAGKGAALRVARLVKQ